MLYVCGSLPLFLGGEVARPAVTVRRGPGAAYAGPASLLAGPETFDTGLLRPSLVALWMSQLIVVAVYPRYARRRGRLRVTDLALAAGATALMVFGLYSSVVNQIVS